MNYEREVMRVFSRQITHEMRCIGGKCPGCDRDLKLWCAYRTREQELHGHVECKSCGLHFYTMLFPQDVRGWGIDGCAKAAVHDGLWCIEDFLRQQAQSESWKLV